MSSSWIFVELVHEAGEVFPGPRELFLCVLFVQICFVIDFLEFLDELIFHDDLWLDGSFPGGFHHLSFSFVLIGGMPSLLGLRGSILFLAVLGGIHIIEEGIGKFADLGVVHLVIFMIEMLLHDPLVARHEAAIRLFCLSTLFALRRVGCHSLGP